MASLSFPRFSGEQRFPDKFYKGRSQEKTHPLRLEFFLLRSPLDRARSALLFRAMCSVAGPCDPVVLVFSTSGFHRLFATKPVSSETSKAERRSSLATIVPLGLEDTAPRNPLRRTRPRRQQSLQ